jgi:hypothetical protein
VYLLSGGVMTVCAPSAVTDSTTPRMTADLMCVNAAFMVMAV